MNGTQTTKYKVEFDFQLLAEVEIDDSETAKAAIKEMVEFWMDWEQRVDHHDGDFNKAFLHNLGEHILIWNKAPEDDEGWYPLDGSYGIKLTYWDSYAFDFEAIKIEEVIPVTLAPDEQ